MREELANPYVWVLPGHTVPVPMGDTHPGAFGALRKFDRHTGVDLYVPEGATVVALEAGVVVAIDHNFTGGDDTPKDVHGEPVWLKTAALLVEGVSGVLLYGEIALEPGLSIGQRVESGQRVGTVQRVLRPKTDGRPYANPANSASMLHMELYRAGTTRAIFWQRDEPQPQGLLDPTALLERSAHAHS